MQRAIGLEVFPSLFELFLVRSLRKHIHACIVSSLRSGALSFQPSLFSTRIGLTLTVL